LWLSTIIDRRIVIFNFDGTSIISLACHTSKASIDHATGLQIEQYALADIPTLKTNGPDLSMLLSIEPKTASWSNVERMM